MGDVLVVDAGEYSTDDLLAALERGQRVVVTTEFLGTEREVTLRYDDEAYYCDTPTRLHRHESREEMRACIDRHGYGDDAPD